MSQTTVPSPAAGGGSPRPSASRAARPPRILGPRAALPGGRAIVGGLLVSAAAVGTFAVYASSTTGPTHHYVVARAAVRTGQPLRADDLRTVAVDLPDELAAQAFTSPADLDGAVALTAVGADEIVQRSAVRTPSAVGAPASTRPELSFALEREHALNGDLQRGERIDLVGTYGSGAEAYTTFVARGVQVLDVDRGAQSTLGAAGRVTITVALADEAGVLEATHALEIAKVTVIRSIGAGDAPAGPDRFPAPGMPPGPASTSPSTAGRSASTTTTTTIARPTTTTPAPAAPDEGAPS